MGDKALLKCRCEGGGWKRLRAAGELSALGRQGALAKLFPGPFHELWGRTWVPSGGTLYHRSRVSVRSLACSRKARGIRSTTHQEEGKAAYNGSDYNENNLCRDVGVRRSRLAQSLAKCCSPATLD